MKAINAIKKVKSHFKKFGIDIQIYPPRAGGSYKWTFQHGDNVGSFSPNGHNGYSESDYFAGSFRKNISQVCESLLSTPPKYTAGQLVRGKQTKRAIRHGIAGRVGLVVPTIGGGSNSNITVSWLNREKPSYGWLSHSALDLELAS